MERRELIEVANTLEHMIHILAGNKGLPERECARICIGILAKTDGGERIVHQLAAHWMDKRDTEKREREELLKAEKKAKVKRESSNKPTPATITAEIATGSSVSVVQEVECDASEPAASGQDQPVQDDTISLDG